MSIPGVKTHLLETNITLKYPDPNYALSRTELRTKSPRTETQEPGDGCL